MSKRADKVRERVEKVRQLVAEGLTDREIGERLGVRENLVQKDRTRLGLQVNLSRVLIDAEAVKLGVSEGKTDQEIASQIGVHRAAISTFRRRNGIARRHACKRHRLDLIRVSELAASGKLDHEIAAELGCPRGTIASFRRCHGIQAAIPKLSTDRSMVTSLGLPSWIRECQRLMLLRLLDGPKTRDQLHQRLGTSINSKVKRDGKHISAFAELERQGMVAKIGKSPKANGHGWQWTYWLTGKSLLMFMSAKGDQRHAEGEKTATAGRSVGHQERGGNQVSVGTG